MGDVYAARAKNADRIGRRLQEFLAEGYIVFDEKGAIVNGRVTLVGWDDKPGISIVDGLFTRVMFTADPSIDDGMHTSIDEFNKKFANWRAVHPRDIKPIFAQRP